MASQKTGGEKKAKELFWLARMAGLLHDIGHAPFSHAGELLFPEKAESVHYKHEEYSIAIIRSSAIGDLINAATELTGVTVDDVCEALNPQSILAPGFLREIISSPWDVDKMDYLLRDALYCGVEYGRFDLRRLIASLTLSTDPGGGLFLAVEEGGLHVLESLVLARYFMFTQVYFHPVRRAFDLLLRDLLAEALQAITGSPVYAKPDNIDAYLDMDDTVIMAYAVKEKEEKARNSAWKILAREHPKAIRSTMPHPSAITIRQVEELYGKIKIRFGNVRFWLDRAIDHPERFREADIMVVREGRGTRNMSFTKISAALRGLEVIGQARIYADLHGDKELRNELQEFCRPYAEKEV